MELSLDAPERLGHSTLADGRRLAWAEWGSPRGTPVVLCPGAAISRHLGISARAVAALGVRLISVDRPGLGASTPAPGRTLADFAADVGELVELRGLGRPALIGNSQGAPFALACAAAGIARALVLVSASDEVAAPEFRNALPPHLRDLLDLVATDTDGATAVRSPATVLAAARGTTVDGTGGLCHVPGIRPSGATSGPSWMATMSTRARSRAWS